MFFTHIKRIVKTGFVNFWRNGAVSVAAVFVFTITLFTLGTLWLVNVVVEESLAEASEQVDITVYFVDDAPEGAIMRLKKEVESLPEVAETFYKSQEQVLNEFREEHKDDPISLQALDLLEGENPFKAELTIRAHDPSQYKAIAQYLANNEVVVGGDRENVIARINYQDVADAIARFDSFTKAVKRVGLAGSIAAMAVAVLTAFTTIALAIYVSREEISIMRLVGASNFYIRGPFLVEGVMYGILATFFAVVILYFMTQWAAESTENFLGAINIHEYFISHFPTLFGALLLTGIFLGVISSGLAIRKYLRV